MPEPLSGITVLEMTLALQGPSAGLYLRDQGAEVIKVEPPTGDPQRYHRGIHNTSPADAPATRLHRREPRQEVGMPRPAPADREGSRDPLAGRGGRVPYQLPGTLSARHGARLRDPGTGASAARVGPGQRFRTERARCEQAHAGRCGAGPRGPVERLRVRGHDAHRPRRRDRRPRRRNAARSRRRHGAVRPCPARPRTKGRDIVRSAISSGCSSGN